MEKLNDILNTPNSLIIQNYFKLQEAAEKKYGQNTVVIIEIGSFFEIYQSDNFGKAQEMSKVLNILLTKKNKKIKEVTETNPFMCGIPSVTLDKYMERLISEDKWTIVLVKQNGTPPNITRSIDKIYSPGTNVDYLTSDEYNFLASVYIGKNKQDIYYGALSMIDLSIGKSYVYENFGTTEDKELPIDEIEQILRTHNVKEIVFTFEKEIEQKVLNAINPKGIPYTSNIEKDYKKAFNVTYQNELFSEIFNAKGFYSAIEDLDLERMPLATAALSVLLTFVIEHNKNIVDNLPKPENIKSKKFMYLGNNPIEQLNIHSANELSVSKIINKGCTAIGRRYITEQLLNPLCDKNEIVERINNSMDFLHNENNEEIRTSLKKIYDIERIWRKVELETISPFEVFNLIESIAEVNVIDNMSKEDCLTISKSMSLRATDLINKTSKIFDASKLCMFNLQNITESFINKGYSTNLDSLTAAHDIIHSDIESYRQSLEDEIGSKVVLNKTDTEGYYLEVTAKIFKEKEFSILNFLVEEELKTKNLKNSVKIYITNLTELSKKETLAWSNLLAEVKEVFFTFAKELYSFKDVYSEYVLYISKIDFYLNNVKLYEEKAYCIPQIIDTDKNFISIEKLRHPIVESIEETGVYIPNTITLGDKSLTTNNTNALYGDDTDFLNGFLLYGINSAGKTVLTKSIGISIILAQAGFFVPATSMEYTLRDSIFTRISGHDNIQKGLSTFAIEMLELKNIFNRATENSLVLGDEISHGTETISGMSIVASTVLELVDLNTLFVLSTHLHQLEDISAVRDLKTVTNAHLSIIYNEDSEKLTYDRTLKSGSGSSVYGLEFAKSLKLPKSFLDRAYKFRDEIAPDLSKAKLLGKDKRSNYNKKVFMTKCAICEEQAIETHHIKEQKDANDKGMHEHVRKNHKFNLLPLCETCHDKIHDGKLKINGFKQTSEGIELDIEQIEE